MSGAEGPRRVGAWASPDPKVTGFYVPATAPVAARLFLLLQDETGRLMSWHEAPELNGRDEPLDAGTEWAEISERPPSGGFAPLSGVEPSPGQIPAALLELLTTVLSDVTGSDTSWIVERAAPFRYPPGSEAGLTAPPWLVISGIMWRIAGRPGALRARRRSSRVSRSWSDRGSSAFFLDESTTRTAPSASPPRPTGPDATSPARTTTSHLDRVAVNHGPPPWVPELRNRALRNPRHATLG